MTYHFPLVRREAIAEGTSAFWLDRSGSDFVFKAGQHADFTLENPPLTDAEGNVRAFSIASSPNAKELLIATRMRDTAFKNSLKTIPLGTNITVSDPMGNFTLHKDASKPAVFVGGGIGITPMRSIIAWATEEKLPHKITLLYSNRTPSLTAFLGELEAMAKENPNFTFVPTITEAADAGWNYEQGMIDAAFVKKHVPDPANSIFYVAGPPAMVTGIIGMLPKAGANEDNIRTEEFGGY